MSQDSYRLTISEDDKVVKGEVLSTLFSHEYHEQFVAEYKKRISPLDVSDYVLIFDCKVLRVQSPIFTPMWEEVLNMYREDGFKRIIYYIEDNEILKLQIKRIAIYAGVQDNLEVIDVDVDKVT